MDKRGVEKVDEGKTGGAEGYGREGKQSKGLMMGIELANEAKRVGMRGLVDKVEMKR